MKWRRDLAVFIAATAAVLSVAVSSSLAGAASEAPTVSTVVIDATTNGAWTNAEVTGATAYDTSTVGGDGTNTPTGTVTYTLYSGACTGTIISTQTVPLDITTGSVPNSATTVALGAGSYSYLATYSGDGVYEPSPSPCESFTVLATPTPPAISNIPSPNPTFSPGGGFTATVSTDSNGTPSATSSTPGVCTASGLVVTYVTAGLCTLTAQVAASTTYAPALGSPQSFTIDPLTPTTATISNIPSPNPTFSPGGGFTATVSSDSNGTPSATSNTPGVCTASGLVVTYVTAGQCTLIAQVAASTTYAAISGTPQSFTIDPLTPSPPTISNLPSNPTYSPEGGFTATVITDSDGTKSVASNTPGVCTASGLVVTYVTAGQCTLIPQVAASTTYAAASGSAYNFTVGRAVPSTPAITNIPSPANELFGFTAVVGTTGDGTTSVTSSTPGVCSVGTNGLTVSFVGFGTCSLTPSVAQGSNYFGATGSPQTFPVYEASHGYWLVGSDGGIFSFGTAAFHGSMGGTPLQRPVVGITPTSTGNGYWLVASDGGIFSFGDAGFYGSIPGVGLHPAGSGLAGSLNAPIVGMVPTSTGQGYFMVASDGGVFAFGDARFEGSCPGIGGCAGAAVAVMPDSTGRGYWLVTSSGSVYAFGDAPFYGAPAPSTVSVVDAVATPSGHGYWLLYANGVVANFGDASVLGGPFGYVDVYNPAAAIFPTKDGLGYWITSARGDVFTYGVAPFLGGLAATGLNGEIIAAYGF